MKISPKPLFRAVKSFIRRNDTKLLKVAAYGLTIAGTALAVRAGMKAKEEINEKEAELKVENQDPEAVLPTKEKAVIIAKKVLPAGAMIVGGAVVHEVAFGIISKKLAIASAIGQFTAARPMFTNSANEQQSMTNDTDEGGDVIAGNGAQIVIPDKFQSLANVEFDVYEPLSGQTMHRCSIMKMAMAEYTINQWYKMEGNATLDWILQFLGGHRMTTPNKFMWQQDFLEHESGLISPIQFMPIFDSANNRVILKFSVEPNDIMHERMLDKFVS